MQPEPRRVSGREGKRNRAVGKVEKEVKGERPDRMEAEEWRRRQGERQWSTGLRIQGLVKGRGKGRGTELLRR